ncbi:LytR/AlgR family response regulator transcription factor [Parapedobacter sp.]
MIQQKIRYAIVDDNSADAESLITHLGKIDYLQQVAIFHDPLQAAKEIPKLDIDLLFLDIDMPGMSGVDLLRLLDKPPMAIFYTAFDEFWQDGYALNVADYLRKPVDFPSVLNGVKKAMVRLGELQISDAELTLGSSQIALPMGDGVHRFEKLADINYIKANNKTSLVSLVHGEGQGERIIEVNMGFGRLVKQLPPDHFFKLDRSTVVALDRIQETLSVGRVVLSIPEGKGLNVTETNLKKLLKISHSR